ncbi:MAG: efflux RND transporter permease subunit [Polyangiales bacterium]
MKTTEPKNESAGLAGTLAKAFVNSKLTPLLIVSSVLLGLMSIVLLPREEEPQIRVPIADILISMEGATAEEVESRVSSPIERLLWEIPGVEYVYTTSMPGRSMAVVRFRVGEDVERSMVKLSQKLMGNADRIPSGVSQPLIKLRSIDDVPILALTLHSARYDELTLRRLAAEVAAHVKRIPEVSETALIGGVRRTVRVELDPARVSAHSLGVADIVPMLRVANQQSSAGSITSHDQDVLVETGAFFRDAEDVESAVVGVFQGRPVYLRDIATVRDAAEDPSQYVFYGHGAASRSQAPEEPAVTLSVAKRANTNAVAVTDAVLAQVEAMRGTTIPSDVTVSITRHYGETAAEKSNELLFHMAIAVVSVSLLILFMLGWRESGVVAVAIPSTLALTLLVFYLVGYTLNRITLFALIFSIGILVDDAIVVVENIVRVRDLPENRGKPLAKIAVEAVAEVGNPTVLATLAVIAAILPMAFVGGLMGPYMRPIPVGATAAMIFSLLVAFIVTPWAAVRILRPNDGKGHGGGHGHDAHGSDDRMTRAYRWLVSRLVTRTAWRWSFLVTIVVLLLGAIAFIPAELVKVKMLPFDNKSEFQIVINMPEGSSLERTAQAAREIAARVRQEPEVTDYQVYVGTASPFNFNGLVRHYYMRRGSSVADLQVNLLPKHDRATQSHDVATRIRPAVAEIARRYGARIAVAEVPPGPPVLQTLVAEVYAPDVESRTRLATAVRDVFRHTPGVVDIDWYMEDPHPMDRFVVDKAKAALHGISPDQITATLRVSATGQSIGLLHAPGEQEDVDVVLDVPRGQRSSTEDLLALRVRAQNGSLVPLRELVRVEHTTQERSIYHKNLLPVTYVIGDVAGEIESSAYAIFAMNHALERLNAGDFGGRPGHVEVWNINQPANDASPSVKWDGEWHITLEVFRDLGAAFVVVLVLIYVLLVGWFRSFLVPLVVMAAIPFSLVGILPAHAAMGSFFTATSMIGFMAGAGIVVRNSIILVDFAAQRMREGMNVADAVVDAGAVRFRPMLLTALAVVVGAGVILFDPIFQGLAISLMAGEIASLLISRVAVPVLYEMALRHVPQHHDERDAHSDTPSTPPVSGGLDELHGLAAVPAAE